MRITVVRVTFARKKEFMWPFSQRRQYCAVFVDRHYAKVWALNILQGRIKLFPKSRHIPVRVEVYNLDCKYFGKIDDHMSVMEAFNIIFNPENLVTKLCVASYGEDCFTDVRTYHRMPASGIACALMKPGVGIIFKRM